MFENKLAIKTIDAHTAGEPLRLIVSGIPEPEGRTILEKRNFLKNNYDHLRTALMWEPRGHADMYGALLTEPERPDSDFGVLFMHNEGFSTMCGHGIIALTKIILETGMKNIEEPITKIKFDAPAGLVTAYAKIRKGNVESIYFENVPSFVLLKNEYITVPDLGKVKFNVAFGGAFYAYVDSDKLGIEITPENYRTLIEAGMKIKNAVMKNFEIVHPFDSDLSFLYGTIFTGKPIGEADSRNVCIFAEGEVDRSPTGTGVSGRMALHFFNGEIGENEPMIIESIIGGKFIGSVSSIVSFGQYQAVIPRVEGTSFLTGQSEFVIDPADPLKNGFILR